MTDRRSVVKSQGKTLSSERSKQHNVSRKTELNSPLSPRAGPPLARWIHACRAAVKFSVSGYSGWGTSATVFGFSRFRRS
jgi:hypothetical protein